VVGVAELSEPEPRPNEVLVRVTASTVSAADRRIRAASYPRGFAVPARLAFGLFRPRKTVLGTELTGVVVRVGTKVSGWKVGDEVIAQTGAKLGAHAELVVLPERGAMVLRPPGLDDHTAAALSFGGTTALYFLRELARVSAGQRVLVIGGAGVVGSAAIQLAAHFGAEVDATCTSLQAAQVRALGATRVLERGVDLDGLGSRYDIILDTVGTTSLRHARPALTASGRLLMVSGDLPALLGTALNPLRRKKAMAGVSPERASDLQVLGDLAAQGHYRPVIDSVFPLHEIAQAHSRAETPGRFGSVVVTF
jgi:NADPH:quinone reductase-like Zn-dependent oxidoreductase